jgi:hypothetical protein
LAQFALEAVGVGDYNYFAGGFGASQRLVDSARTVVECTRHGGHHTDPVAQGDQFLDRDDLASAFDGDWEERFLATKRNDIVGEAMRLPQQDKGLLIDILYPNGFLLR